MSKNEMSNDALRSQINDIIEGEIQNGINDYLEDKEKKKETKGFGGDVPQDEGSELNVRISKNEVDRIMKEYKRIKRQERSNLGQVQKLGIVDKNGRPIDVKD